MIDKFNAMSTQTAAFVLLMFATVFLVIAIRCTGAAAQMAVFGLSQNLVGGTLLMLKATAKEVNTNNLAGSNVGQQNNAPDAASTEVK